MNYQTLLINKSNGFVTVIFNRPEERNSMNSQFMNEFNHFLNEIERDPEHKIIILEGKDGFFSTGMDLKEANEMGFVDDITQVKESKKVYSNMIKKLSLMPKFIISKVDGQVMAGGVGIVAASDLVCATPRSQFSLSEAIWGLLPCMVMPYLMRRVGFQNAYRMTMTTLPVNAHKALEMNLADEVGESLDEIIRKYLLRLMRISEKTIETAKGYFRKMWIINEQMEQMAIDQISELESDPRVRENISNFVTYNKFPWDK